MPIGLSSDRESCPLVRQFDIYLLIIEDAYLGFFRERSKIEEIYVDSLRKLHRKAKAIDAYFEVNVEKCTMRAAWDKVRDGLEREAQVRQEFLTTLANEIISPLTALKESQSRTREQVKHDLKESAAAHADFSKKIPKFKEAYRRKCQEVRESDPPLSLHPSNNTMTSFLSRDLSSTSDLSSVLPSRQHDRNRRSVLGASPSRLSSASGSITGITRQLIDGIRGTNRNAEVVPRSVLAREAADLADIDYRGAIHHLETLRLRKLSKLASARKSLEGFILEGTEAAKEMLLRYVTVMIKACTAHSKVATDAQAVIENISAENDSSVLFAALQPSLATTIPRPIFYDNYHVGECPDLVFGRRLVDYATAQGSEDHVPKILRVCIKEVNRRGLEVTGIYRIPGRDAKVKDLQGRFERSERTFSFNPQRDDIHSIASLLKLYLQELPEPLFRFPLQDRIRDSEKLADDIAKVSLLRSKIRELPTIHRVSLRALVKHLSCVASHARKNKMDVKSLAAAFGLVVFGEDEIPRGDPQKLWSKDYVMEILIENADTLFEESLPSRPTGPLPEPINTHSSLTLQTSAVPRQSEGAQDAGFDPRWHRRSTIDSVSSPSLSCPPMSPSSSSAGSSGSPMSKQPHMLTELPNLNFSALHLYDGGVADQQEPQQDWAPVADARNTAVLRERGVTRLPSRLAPVPEQPQERKRQPEALAYMPMSPQTISSYDPCTTVASMMSPPASRDDGLLC